MSPNEYKGYDKPQFDGRVKQILQIESIYRLLWRCAIVILASVIAGLTFSMAASASSMPDLFIVPAVTLTPSGAAVFQPQTGDGYEALSDVKRTTFGSEIAPSRTRLVEAGTSSNFSGGVYIPPKYDAFAEGSADKKIDLPPENIRNIDSVNFLIRNNLPGVTEKTFGTTKTIFTFVADVSAKDYRNGELEYRWDFENDGELDSYFSKIKSISHVYTTPGEYEVKLEVLDGQGQVSSVVKTVHIVENDPPLAYFRVDKLTAPKNSIFRFDSSFSSDSQYRRGNLFYRFDWNGDGTFDTNFQNKTIWNHLFRDPGTYNVIMQVKDPEGLTAKAQLTINVLEDMPPEARLSIERVGDLRYQFDASQSSDDFTPLRSLKFRWDFNYTGSNDIVLDSNWNSSPKYTGYYRIGGSKTVRLQVMDQQGFISESYAEIEVPWPEDYFNMAVEALRA